MPPRLTRRTSAPRRAPGRLLAGLLGGSLLLLSACDQPRAHGDEHAIIVGAEPALWDLVEDDLEDAVAPTIQMVRTERAFRVTFQDPHAASEWGTLRRFRNMLVLGSEGDPWIDEVLAARPRGAAPVSPPALVRVPNVWARGQTVTAVVLPSSTDAEGVRGVLPELSGILDEEYRAFVRTRMFVSGRDTILADSLATHVGFRLLLPNVYRHSVQDSVFRFRNDNPSPAELIREIGVTWTSPLPEELPDAAWMLDWRTRFATENYQDAQEPDTTLTSFRSVEVGGAPGVEFQAAWVSPPDAWPAGGPFLARAVACAEQDRLYLLDAWLYAPARASYEYLIQLQTILDSFACAPGFVPDGSS